MSHDWNERLHGIERVLNAQNERLESVKEALADLPRHFSIELASDWRDAFEDAIETLPEVHLKQRPAQGAIRG